MESYGRKILEIAIPPVEMNANQAKAFQETMEYASKNDVEIIVRIIE